MANRIERLTGYLMKTLSARELDELHNELHRRGHVFYGQAPGVQMNGGGPRATLFPRLRAHARLAEALRKKGG